MLLQNTIFFAFVIGITNIQKFPPNNLEEREARASLLKYLHFDDFSFTAMFKSCLFPLHVPAIASSTWQFSLSPERFSWSNMKLA